MEAVVVTPKSSFWRGKRVLVTGQTGFKGSWLSLWLAQLGAEVKGFALPPEKSPNLFEKVGVSKLIHSNLGDINDSAELARAVARANPDIVFHLAAQPIVLKGYEAPEETFATNVVGTVNLLAILRNAPSLRSVVVITTDKVYRNREVSVPYVESDELGGHDPYSASKAACEIAVAAMRASYFGGKASIATARAGNVIGGGDWADNRILPDAARAWGSGQKLVVRNPHAIRPWQHVLEPLSGYLALAEAAFGSEAFAKSYNFGPPVADSVSVRNLLELAREKFGRGATEFAGTSPAHHEAGILMLDSTLAARELNVQPRWPLAMAVERTMQWYAKFLAGEPAADLCRADIELFEKS